MTLQGAHKLAHEALVPSSLWRPGLLNPDMMAAHDDLLAYSSQLPQGPRCVNSDAEWVMRRA